MTAREISGREAATVHVELITGFRETPLHVRLIHDSNNSKPAKKLYGTLGELWPEIETAQAQGYGAFLVVNDGGNADAKITRIRAVFVDADDVPLPSNWHIPPDFIVQRDATHWHAYWRVFELPVEKFREIQRRLAAHYGTDPAVCNPSRVMRLAGTFHQKAAVP
jgi:hypothetical protein